MTSLDTVTSFSRMTNAELTIMPGGDHWFHTREQLKFLDDWIKKSI